MNGAELAEKGCLERSSDPLANLYPVFDGHAPTFMVTDEDLQATLNARGLEAHLLLADGTGAVPPDAVLVISAMTILRMTQVLRDRFASSRTLIVPVAAFDQATAAAEYTVDVMLASDFVAAAERNARWKAALQRIPSPLVFIDPRHPDRELRCHLLGDLTVNGREAIAIHPGEWVSPAEYFEVAMESFGPAPTLFSVEGQLSVSGLLAAKAPDMPADRYGRHDAALRIVHEFATGWRSGVLRCEGNKPVRFEPDGDSAPAGDRLYEQLMDAGESEDGHNIIEFSIGTNITPDLDIDWSVNSCMNEGLRGIHLAVGDGVYGAHVDFVSAGAIPQLSA